MEFVIVTGVSGSGKSCVVKALEDIGFFCVDNMPPQLIHKFADICKGNSSIEQVAFVFFVGICHACSIMTGKTIGEGDDTGAYKLAKKFVIMTPIIGVVTGSVLAIMREPILSLLGIETQGAFDIASSLILLYCLWLPVRNIPYTLIVGTFRAGGDTKIGIVYDCLSLYLLSVPVVVILGLVVKVDFIYLILAMYLCEDIPKTIMSLFRFKSKKWIRNLTDK